MVAADVEKEVLPTEPVLAPAFNEKKDSHDVEIESANQDNISEVDSGKRFVPDENDEFIDPRLKDYEIPLVAYVVCFTAHPVGHSSSHRVVF